MEEKRKTCLFIKKVEGIQGKSKIKKDLLTKEVFSYTHNERLNISFSYCDEYILCAVAKKTVGVDIESIDRINEKEDGMELLFGDDDKTISSGIPPDFRWTMHEAIGKVTGTGLGRKIDLLSLKSLGSAQEKIDIFGNKEKISVNEYLLEYRFRGEIKSAAVYAGKYLKYYITVAEDR